jgi:DNA-directed RNA polymerase specialized sigma subunit
MFPTVRDVVKGLVLYTDWWQPRTTSVLQVGRRRGFDDGIRDGHLDSLVDRAELRRRVLELNDQDRMILFLWYLRELPAHEIAREVGISRRQCFRRRAAALASLVDDTESAA